jgi:hypothetical protein
MRNIKFAFLVLTIFLTSNLYSKENQGVITVLEAPLFLTPDKGSDIIQHVRKGDTIYVHHQYFIDNNQLENKEREPDNFYITTDKSGRTAYILKEHVKLLFNDARELASPIDNRKHDSTDYRLEEPLPPDYPFNFFDHYRASVQLGTLFSPQTNYSYNTPVKEQSKSNQYYLSALFLKKTKIDYSERLYFGGKIKLAYQRNKFTLDRRDSTEIDTTIGLGPYISYDIYRTFKYRITLNGSTLINIINKRNITQELSNGETDSKDFSTISIVPTIGATFEKLNILPNFDMVTGVNFGLELAHTMKNKEGSSKPELWNSSSNDIIKRPTRGQLSFFVGLQRSY